MKRYDDALIEKYMMAGQRCTSRWEVYAAYWRDQKSLRETAEFLGLAEKAVERRIERLRKAAKKWQGKQ